jgi:hypothetical protein
LSAYAQITHLSFVDEASASEEVAELQRQAPEIGVMRGFGALLVVRSGPTDVAIVRIFADAEGVARSMGTTLRRDLAGRFARPPDRTSGHVVVGRFAAGANGGSAHADFGPDDRRRYDTAVPPEISRQQ